MWHYEHCGLRVVSECAIGGLDAVERVDAADVRVVLERPVAARADEPPAVDVSDRECRIRFPGVADYEIREGADIVIRPHSGAEPSAVSLFLLGAVWASLLHQRGSFPLHAGVTADGDGAIAFCGPRGAGKSSTVARLLARGHDLVSDDLTRVDVGSDGPPLVWSSVARLKLSPAAAAANGWSSAGVGAPMPDGKLHMPWKAGRRGPLPLHAIYALSWGEAGVTRRRGHEAVELLAARATYRPELLGPRDGLARHWLQCAAIAQRIPVYELSRPRDWSSMLPTRPPA